MKPLVKTVVLLDTLTRNVIGVVVTLQDIDYLEFYDRILKSWREFDLIKPDDYSIEHFVDYHNEIYKMQIDSALGDHIHL